VPERAFWPIKGFRPGAQKGLRAQCPRRALGQGPERAFCPMA